MACKYKYKDKWYSEIEVKNQLLKDISLNDVIVELSSQMSYSVEINTAKENAKTFNKIQGYDAENVDINSLRIEESDWGGSYIIVDKNGKHLTPLEYTKEEAEEILAGIGNINTQYYSNLAVPGGTNGSYREVNIESPLITLPKSHAQFNTEHTLMFSRMDDVQTYSEKDIEKLISLMENNGQLKIKCNS